MRRPLVDGGDDPGRHDERYEQEPRAETPPAPPNNRLEHTRRHTRPLVTHPPTVAPGLPCRSVPDMKLSIEPPSDDVHRKLRAWRYPPPYDFQGSLAKSGSGSYRASPG